MKAYWKTVFVLAVLSMVAVPFVVRTRRDGDSLRDVTSVPKKERLADARSSSAKNEPRDYGKAGMAEPKSTGGNQAGLPVLKAELAGEYLKRFMSVCKGTEYDSHSNFTVSGTTMRFRRESEFNLREGRLLALVFPDETEKAAMEIVDDPTQDMGCRKYAIFVLGVLAGKGRRTSEDTLYRLAMGDNAVLANNSIMQLWRSDKDGKYKDLYWSRCREATTDYSLAFHAVSSWADGATLDLMKEIMARRGGDVSIRFGFAKCAAIQVQVLLSPDWQSKLESVLETGNLGEMIEMYTTPWALKVARDRSLPTLKECLRRRLDRAEERGRSFQSFEEQFSRSASIGFVGDTNIDDVLIAYAEAGGELNDIEKRRLRTFGYNCNPAERLAELMAEMEAQKE